MSCKIVTSFSQRQALIKSKNAEMLHRIRRFQEQMKRQRQYKLDESCKKLKNITDIQQNFHRIQNCNNDQLIMKFRNLQDSVHNEYLHDEKCQEKHKKHLMNQKIMQARGHGVKSHSVNIETQNSPRPKRIFKMRYRKDNSSDRSSMSDSVKVTKSELAFPHQRIFNLNREINSKREHMNNKLNSVLQKSKSVISYSLKETQSEHSTKTNHFRFPRSLQNDSRNSHQRSEKAEPESRPTLILRQRFHKRYLVIKRQPEHQLNIPRLHTSDKTLTLEQSSSNTIAKETNSEPIQIKLSKTEKSPRLKILDFQQMSPDIRINHWLDLSTLNPTNFVERQFRALSINRNIRERLGKNRKYIVKSQGDMISSIGGLYSTRITRDLQNAQIILNEKTISQT